MLSLDPKGNGNSKMGAMGTDMGGEETWEGSKCVGLYLPVGFE